MTVFLKLSAWLLAAAVTFVTLGPPRFRPLTHLGHDVEHALAFVLLGLAFGLAYPRRRLSISLVAVVLTGVLEILQLWMPGRHARLEDFIVDAASACVGFAIATAVEWLILQVRGTNANAT